MNTLSRGLQTEMLGLIDEVLALLWATRNSREEPFAEAVNLLQGIVSMGDYTDKQLAHLCSAVGGLCRKSYCSDRYVNALTRRLLRDGFAVFQGME